MTCRTIRGWVQFQLITQSLAERQGVFIARIAGLPGHAGDLVERPEVGFGITMAFEAPGHAERLFVLDHFHLIDSTMAGDAADATVDVGRVIEVDKVRQAMHLDPFNWLILVPAFPDEFEAAFPDCDLGMTGHAGFGWRDVGLARLFHIGVAVSTIDTELPGMDFVTVVYRLMGLIAHVGRLVVEAKPGQNQEDDRSGQSDGKDDLPGVVEPFREEEQRLLRCRSGGSFRHRGRLVLVPTMMTKPHRLWEVSRFDANDKTASGQE